MWKRVIIVAAILIIMGLTFALSGCDNNSQYVKVPKELEKIWNQELAFDMKECSEIYIPKTRALRVLQLTDVHYDHNNNKKPETLALIKDVIKRAKPDIIALTGDWSSQRTDTLAHVKAVFDTIDDSGVKWAPVFGNHDGEGELSRVDYIPIFNGYSNCLFNAGYTNIGGLGNYIVNVRQDNAQGKLVNSLVFMDSHTSTRYGVSKYLPMTSQQVDWYEWAIKGVNSEFNRGGGIGTIQSMAFFHIPTPEYSKAFENKIIIGENNEKSYPPYKNCGIIDEMIDLGSTKAVFTGHDHDNNAVAEYKGMLLGYGVESGWCEGYAEKSKKGGLLICMDAVGKIDLEQIVYDMT